MQSDQPEIFITYLLRSERGPDVDGPGAGSGRVRHGCTRVSRQPGEMPTEKLAALTARPERSAPRRHDARSAKL